MNTESINKEQWVSLFKAAGLDQTMMEKWHQAFEARHPGVHQLFLQWLQIPENEITAIRTRSQDQ